MDASEAAASGDRLRMLYVSRERLARALDETESAREIGTLTLRLDQVMAAIEEIEQRMAPQVGTPLDEIWRRRAERLRAQGRTA